MRGFQRSPQPDKRAPAKLRARPLMKPSCKKTADRAQLHCAGHGLRRHALAIQHARTFGSSPAWAHSPVSAVPRLPITSSAQGSFSRVLHPTLAIASCNPVFKTRLFASTYIQHVQIRAAACCSLGITVRSKAERNNKSGEGSRGHVVADLSRKAKHTGARAVLLFLGWHSLIRK